MSSIPHPHLMDEERVKKRFGEILRELRASKELSQERLALETGLDRTFISMLERGKRQPSLFTVFVLADSLGVLPSKLIKKCEDDFFR